MPISPLSEAYSARVEVPAIIKQMASQQLHAVRIRMLPFALEDGTPDGCI